MTSPVRVIVSQSVTVFGGGKGPDISASAEQNGIRNKYRIAVRPKRRVDTTQEDIDGAASRSSFTNH